MTDDDQVGHRARERWGAALADVAAVVEHRFKDADELAMIPELVNAMNMIEEVNR